MWTANRIAALSMMTLVLVGCLVQGSSANESSLATPGVTQTSSQGDPSVTTPQFTLNGPEGREGLADIHRSVLESESALVTVDLIEFVGSPAQTVATITAEINEVIWPSPRLTPEEQAMIDDVTEVTVTLRGSSWDAVTEALPFAAVGAINIDGELWALAKTGIEPGSIEAIGEPGGPMSLGYYAVAAFADPISLIPVINTDACAASLYEYPILDPRPATAEQTIVAYFDELGERTVDEVRAKAEPAEQIAEEIAESVEMTDPVTGQSVYGDVRDIYAQLLDGVAPENVEIRPVVNVGLTIRDEYPNQVLVFFALPDQFLGWVPAGTGFTVDEDGNETPVDSVLIEMLAPQGGEDVGVYLRDAGTKYGCGETLPQEATLVLTIPYDDVAGSQRALIDVDNETHEQLPEILINGVPSE